jgi:TPR repeat protein
MKPGSLATLTVMRAGARKELPVTIGGRVTDNRAAAEAGNPQSQMVLATAYHFGTGVEKDTAEAFRWAKRAAEQGVADGQTFVGYYYANGEVVEKNDYTAVEWYRKAAAQNERAAFNNLGTYYETGRGGLSQDLNQAIDHYRRSAALGYQLAIDNLKRLEVDPFDLAEIQRDLAALGYDPGPIDGKMGSKTEAAIGTFQAQAVIAVDGKSSLELARRIREARTAETPAPAVESPGDTPVARPGEPGNLKELDSLE